MGQERILGSSVVREDTLLPSRDYGTRAERKHGSGQEPRPPWFPMAKHLAVVKK